MSVKLQYKLGVSDILDTAAGLRIHAVRPLLDPTMRPVCRDHVQADLASVRAGVGTDVVYCERQALSRLGEALLLDLAGEGRKGFLGLQGRAELVPA